MNNVENSVYLKTRKDLREFISIESKLYGNKNSLDIFALLRSYLSNPQSDQYYSWKYVKTLRYTEWHYNNCIVLQPKCVF